MLHHLQHGHHLRYTAADGGEIFRDVVIKEEKIKNYSGVRYVSLRQEFSAAWQRAKEASSQKLDFDVQRNMFPLNLKSVTVAKKISLLTYPPEQKLQLKLNEKLVENGKVDAPSQKEACSLSPTEEGK